MIHKWCLSLFFISFPFFSHFSFKILSYTKMMAFIILVSYNITHDQILTRDQTLTSFFPSPTSPPHPQTTVFLTFALKTLNTLIGKSQFLSLALRGGLPPAVCFNNILCSSFVFRDSSFSYFMPLSFIHLIVAHSFPPAI